MSIIETITGYLNFDTHPLICGILLVGAAYIGVHIFLHIIDDIRDYMYVGQRKVKESAHQHRIIRSGKIGERTVSKLLKKLPKSEYTILNDALVRTVSGGTSQIDHVVVSKYGIFVIETKRYSGVITGCAEDFTWEQSINYSKPIKINNPLWQNYNHTVALRGLNRQLNENVFIPITTFDHTCNLSLSTHSDYMCYYDELLNVIESHSAPLLSAADINDVIDTIRCANITSKKERKAHIQRIENAKTAY